MKSKVSKKRTPGVSSTTHSTEMYDFMRSTTSTNFSIQSPVTNGNANSSNVIMYGSRESALVSPQTITTNFVQSTSAMKTLRQTFIDGKTLPLEHRKKLLRNLQIMVTEGQRQLTDAIWLDLKRHPAETYSLELSAVHAEIQLHLDHLNEWVKPKVITNYNFTTWPSQSYIVTQPRGVICILGAWHLPIRMMLLPLIAALSAGNCALLIFSGGDTTKNTNEALASLLERYVDQRYVRLVGGGREMATHVLLHDQFDLVFASGGPLMGRVVARAASESLTPTILELGGKNPAIVTHTCNVQMAAKKIAWASFLNAGQTSMRPDYVLVDALVGDKFTKAVESWVMHFYGSDPKSSESFGRLVNKRAFDRIDSILKSDRRWITFGGYKDARDKFISPTLLHFGKNLPAFGTSSAMVDEIFGPILPIVYYNQGHIDSALMFVLQRTRPLALYLFTQDEYVRHRVEQRMHSGSFVVNDCMAHTFHPTLPVGGIGGSGMGKYQGKAGFDAFSHQKSTLRKSEWNDLEAKYPPYTDASESKLKRAMQPSKRTHRTVAVLGLVLFIIIFLLILSTI